MKIFFELWHHASMISLGLFWMALWAFALGYFVSSLIQVLVTKQRMQRMMGIAGPKSMILGAFFGFVSSSCSFAALSTTRALFQKGAGLAPAMAFMLASTNLVIELGIIIALFLSWQFVVGEYLGGILLILFAWLFIRFFYPNTLIQNAREKLDSEHTSTDNKGEDWKEKVSSWSGWSEIGTTYVMEWQMVWKDVLIGFTIAGIIAAFVPDTFFTHLFIGTGGSQAENPSFGAIFFQALIGPVVAFFTFIGSMGNIPLAALLYDNGVSFAGVMAFIFSDLVVFPVLRINAKYYGWKMAFYILAMLLSGLIIVSLLLHYSLAGLNILPHPTGTDTLVNRNHFAINYGFYLNILFLGISAFLSWIWWSTKKNTDYKHHEHKEHDAIQISTYIFKFSVFAAFIWIVGGISLPIIIL
ncbi:permease [Desulfogranum japonicum]|uniref:permease n=1 Tax=Desulfogranum japonicum TaxID=231447 RepID=UPI00040768EB|nr:permease [Desulfogranum japonicum]